MLRSGEPGEVGFLSAPPRVAQTLRRDSDRLADVNETQDRPYQRELLESVQAALSRAKARVMMQLPTGGGKTVIAGKLLAGRLRAGRKGVWLTHRRELAGQSQDRLVEGGVQAITNTRWSPGTPASSIDGGVVILMAQTVSRRTAVGDVWVNYSKDDLLVIDEAHHATAAGWKRAICQWPGPVLGMTATPWRLSEKEGFDHLFDELICGPQVAELQECPRFLCRAEVFVPADEDRIATGDIGATGDFTESGIENANAGHEDIMTARALRFWRIHAQGRPTIAYAVSKQHASNLVAVFNGADIPAALLLGDTEASARQAAHRGFETGEIKVLVNVAVATEGFDLPDAACVLIARPTMSLALYLQMVGRGLRSKTRSKFDNCVVLDLAANSLRHGLPERDQTWSLKPRGPKRLTNGGGPVVRCPHCEAVSPASAHHCRSCGHPFGKACFRCGKWRPWKRWEWENFCGDQHERVCDLCHADAHVDSHLAIPPEIGNVAIDGFGEGAMPAGDMVIDDELAENLGRGLKRLLQSELAVAKTAHEGRVAELRDWLASASSELADDDLLARSYEDHLSTLAEGERPRNRAQEARRFVEYEDSLRSSLSERQRELDSLENQPIEDRSVMERAQQKVMHMLRREALELGLDAYAAAQVSPSASVARGERHRAGEDTETMDVEPAHRLLYIKVRRQTVEERGLYEAVRGIWKVDPARARNAEWVVAVVDKVCRGVFEAHSWARSARNPQRFEFVGRQLDPGSEVARRYVGKLIPEQYRRRGMASPVLYGW